MGQDLGDCTDICRGAILFKPPGRVHRHIVIGLIGDPITSFRSKKEFVKVMLDIVQCEFSSLSSHLQPIDPLYQFSNS